MMDFLLLWVLMDDLHFYWQLDGDSQDTVMRVSDEIAYWGRCNCEERFDLRFTYHNGEPCLAIAFRKPKDAMLFKLTWYEGLYE